MNRPFIRLLPVLAAVLLVSTSTPADAQAFPVKPTPYEDTYFVMTFSCPYPTPHRAPQVSRVGTRIFIEAVTSGSVCFTGVDTEVPFAVNLGRLPADTYDVIIQLNYELSPNGTVVSFSGQPQERKLRVRDHTPVRVTGLWFDPALSTQGLNFLLAPNGELVVQWLTFAPDGEALWLFGQAMPEGLQASVEMFLPSGGRFGAGGGSPRLDTLGTLNISFTSCGRAQAAWQSSVPGFASRTLNLVQLSSGDGLGHCTPDAILEWRDWR